MSNIKCIDIIDLMDIQPANKTFTISTVNVRSMRNKTEEIQEVLLTNSLQLVLLTETWLSPEDDVSWINSQNYNMCGYKIDCVSRGSRGGGVALVTQQDISVHKLDCQTDLFYEYGLWRLEAYGKTITVMGVYRPPQGSANALPNSIFVDRFLDKLEDIIAAHRNLIILGDFNIHLDDLNDQDAVFFSEAMSSLGFNQNIKVATHTSGHTIDLIFTERGLDVDNTRVLDFISDHRWVMTDVQMLKRTDKKKKIEVQTRTSDFQTTFDQAFNERENYGL